MKIKQTGVNTSGVHHKSGKSHRDAPQRRETRLQVQVRFNLNLRHDDEKMLADDVAYLRQNRQFRPTIIKALKLFFDLKDGYLDVLTELFPEVVERIQRNAQNAEIEALRREIAELKARTLTAPVAAHETPSVTNGSPFGTAKNATLKLTKGIAVSTGKAFANSIGGYFD